MYEQLASESTDADPDDDAGEPASAREARYRTRLREAEGRVETQERVITALQEQIAARDCADAERLAGARLADGADLWAAGVQLDDLLGDDGRLSEAKVNEAVARVLNRRPHWQASRYRGPLSSGASNQSEPRTSSWAGAFAPPRD